jgi:hypothetical protein
VLLGQLAISIIHASLTRLGFRKFIFVYFGQTLLALGILQLEESRRQERFVIHGSFSYDVIKTMFQDARLNALFETLHGLFGDHRH